MNLLDKAKSIPSRMNAVKEGPLSIDEIELFRAYLTKEINGTQFAAASDKKATASNGIAFSYFKRAFRSGQLYFNPPKKGK